MPRADNLEILIWAQRQLMRVRYELGYADAPKTLAKVRSALKSIDGAIRHAENKRVRAQEAK